jgi:hypothetical protein
MADQHSQELHTDAGRRFRDALTAWLQDTRLASEAVFRLYREYKASNAVDFNAYSWPKKDGVADFAVFPSQLDSRMQGLLKNTWSTRFVFLETLWEEYLQELVIELGHTDAKVLEPFCEKQYMSKIIKDVLTDKITQIDEIKFDVAVRFAAGLTRQQWSEQWKQLQRLNIGISDNEAGLDWYDDLDVYFEIRNCIIHRKSRVSTLLASKSEHYKSQLDSGNETLEIWPGQIDYYRHAFLKCLRYLESKIKSRFQNA